jgi:hypothetical protein
MAAALFTASARIIGVSRTILNERSTDVRKFLARNVSSMPKEAATFGIMSRFRVELGNGWFWNKTDT